MIKKLTDFQTSCLRTFKRKETVEEDLFHCHMGIYTETAELIDAFKKNFAYNKEIDITNVSEEISDAIFYIVIRKWLLKEDLQEPMFVQYESFEEHLKAIMSWQNCSDDSLINDLYSLCESLQIDFWKGLENNVAKLKVRYNDKFTEEEALNRNLKLERQELEK
jgi:hypothetical protein